MSPSNMLNKECTVDGSHSVILDIQYVGGHNHTRKVPSLHKDIGSSDAKKEGEHHFTSMITYY